MTRVIGHLDLKWTSVRLQVNMSVLFSLSGHYGAFGERRCWSLRVQDDDYGKQVRPNHSFNTDTNGAARFTLLKRSYDKQQLQ